MSLLAVYEPVANVLAHLSLSPSYQDGDILWRRENEQIYACNTSLVEQGIQYAIELQNSYTTIYQTIPSEGMYNATDDLQAFMNGQISHAPIMREGPTMTLFIILLSINTPVNIGEEAQFTVVQEGDKCAIQFDSKRSMDNWNASAMLKNMSDYAVLANATLSGQTYSIPLPGADFSPRVAALYLTLTTDQQTFERITTNAKQSGRNPVAKS